MRGNLVRLVQFDSASLRKQRVDTSEAQILSLTLSIFHSLAGIFLLVRRETYHM